MVSIQYQRKQAEEVARKERLQAARRVAADASIRNAKRYEAEKQRQRAAVRGELEAHWRAETLEKQATVQRLLDDAFVKQGKGMRQAAEAVRAERHAAHTEVAAWEAERQLESARHRLAVAAQRAEQQAQEQPRTDFVERKRLVRELEKQRTALVLAKPPAPTYEDVVQQLAPSPSAEERRVLGAATVGAGRRSLVHVPAEDERYSFHPQDAAAVVETQTREAQAEAAAAVRNQHEEASRRAADALRERRRQSEQHEREAQERQARRKVIAEEYRRPPCPPDPDETTVGEEDGGDTSARVSPQLPRSRGNEAVEAAAEELALHPATYRQRVLQTVRQAEDAFAEAFVRGPPVLLKEEVSLPPCAPRSMEELLRPARLCDLLPARDAAVDDDSADDASAPVPAFVACVRPCRFQTQPFRLYTDEPRGYPTEKEPPLTESSAYNFPTAAVAPAASSQGCEPVVECVVETAPAQAQQAAALTGVENELHETVSRSPSDDQSLARDVAAAAEGPREETASHEVSRISAQEMQGASQVEVSHMTNLSLSSSQCACRANAKAAGEKPTESSRYDDAMSSSSSSTSEPCTLDEHEDSTFTSSTASHHYPTMTAEQLKIALIRLRNRMRAVQL